MNVGRVAAVEFKDWLYRRAHLLALHVCGVTGNTHSHASNEGRDDRFVSGWRASPFPPARGRPYRRWNECQLAARNIDITTASYVLGLQLFVHAGNPLWYDSTTHYLRGSEIGRIRRRRSCA